MKILVVEPNKMPYPKEITGSLESMQKIVGGLITAIYPFPEPIALVCHDEGKLLSLTLNRALREQSGGRILDIIAGTFFLCGCPEDSDSFVSLTDEQMQLYHALFYRPELFIQVGDEIIALPSPAGVTKESDAGRGDT